MTLREKFEDIENLGYYSDNGHATWSTKILEKQSIECEKIADDFAIGFGEFLRKNYYDTGSNWHKEPDKDYTTKELLEIYKKENGL